MLNANDEEIANDKKNEWAVMLHKAWSKKDWAEITELLIEMENFDFKKGK